MIAIKLPYRNIYIGNNHMFSSLIKKCILYEVGAPHIMQLSLGVSIVCENNVDKTFVSVPYRYIPISPKIQIQYFLIKKLNCHHLFFLVVFKTCLTLL